MTTRDQKVCQLNYFAYLKTLFLTHWKYCFLRPYISSKTAPITELVGNYDTSLGGRRFGSFRRERNARAGSREEVGEEMPARRPLFWPSRLLIMYVKITQLWMTRCQISLAAIHLLAFVFQKQEIWGEVACLQTSPISFLLHAEKGQRK